MAPLLMVGWSILIDRLDRLEAGRYIVRERDPNDRRSVLVSMTDAGRSLFDEAVSEEAEAEQRIVGVLSPEEQHRLNDLLRRLVLAFPPEKE